MSELTYVAVKEPEHIAELANYAEGIFREYFSGFHPADKVEYLVKHLLSIDTLIRSIADEGYEYYFVDDELEHVGFIGIKDYGDHLFLSKLYLQKDARGKGYGRKEFEFVKQRARELGLPKIRLTVARDNDASWQKYLHMGFEIVDEVDSEVGEGFQMNDYIMECPVEIDAPS